jgi:hypothetical protein
VHDGGNGKQFFKDGLQPNGLKLKSMQTLEKGVIVLSYQTMQ